MTGAQAPDALARLRQTMNNSQHYQYDKAELPLSLGLGEPDALLGGGLARRALHEIAPLAPIHFGAACGFVLALAALAGKHAAAAGTRSGSRPICARCEVRRALRHRPRSVRAAVAAAAGAAGAASDRRAVCDGGGAQMPRRRKRDRRIAGRHRRPDRDAPAVARRARRMTALGLLLRHRSTSAPSAAMTRWEVAASPARATPSAASARPRSCSLW